jgi:hypothetical protein
LVKELELSEMGEYYSKLWKLILRYKFKYIL